MHIALVDIDNTICQTNEKIYTKVNRIDVDPLSLPQEFFMNNPDVYLDAEPALGAAEKLKEFIEQGNHLFYVTEREAWTKTITEFWFKEHNFPRLPVIYTDDKRRAALRLKATLCIEDDPCELQTLMDLIPAFVPAKNYNKSFKRRFKDWSSLNLT